MFGSYGLLDVVIRGVCFVRATFRLSSSMCRRAAASRTPSARSFYTSVASFECHRAAANRALMARSFYTSGTPPPPMFFVCVANTGVTGAIVLCSANAGVKDECFHTLKPPLVSADSKGFKCYPYSYYSARFGGICRDSCVNVSHFGQFTSFWYQSAEGQNHWRF